MEPEEGVGVCVSVSGGRVGGDYLRDLRKDMPAKHTDQWMAVVAMVCGLLTDCFKCASTQRRRPGPKLGNCVRGCGPETREETELKSDILIGRPTHFHQLRFLPVHRETFVQFRAHGMGGEKKNLWVQEGRNR
ncbi:WUSCHEL-related homeobox 8-like protein [Anopheles sinensis]|uniref:WUSCHEL-related homeobox 8-like protein n=1 Tax=Anopheles sinensis TaxID=74873 RepID=A0A084VYI4_ANOSI|nr:WUSCHEL-related homeobox 8-like protein [Anopheles sinensis]